MALDESYDQLREAFLAFHRDEQNIMLHLLTGSIGVFGTCCLLYRMTNRSVAALSFAVIFYALSLVDAVPLELVLLVASFLGTSIPLVKTADLSVFASVTAIVLAYFGQDAAHYFTGEKTFQSSYSGADSLSSVGNATEWISNFSEHTFFLLPLTVDAALPLLPSPVRSSIAQGELETPSWLSGMHDHLWLLALLALWVGGCYALDSDLGPFPWQFVKSRMLRCNLSSNSLRRDLASIRRWATDHAPSKETTTHWWFSDLGSAEADAFTRIALSREVDDMFREKFSREGYAIDAIDGMNELYVSGPEKQGSSDTVFTTRHTDGPWALMPFCSTYRCILGLDSSSIYTTVFPNVPTEKTCRTGDLVAFDYHREIHYIVGNPNCKEEQSKLAPSAGGDGYRIVLKLHYCVYPKFLWPLGKLAASMSLWYNVLFRKIFLFSLTPSDLPSRIMAFLVVQVTKLYRVAIEIGFQNMLYVVSMAIAGYLVHPYVFLVGTSYVHYLRYLTTYYHRKNCNFGTFKSDVLFFKTIAIGHLACRYIWSLSSSLDNPALVLVSIAMIVAGATVSMTATCALGIDGTYFGSELGLCSTERVSSFPYNAIPHPMITGQIFAFVGVNLLPAFRAQWPLLIPAHCLMYTLVMLEEQFDVHASKGREIISEMEVSGSKTVS